MIPLTVKADVSSTTDLFGKVVTDLQTNVRVRGSNVTGTLKYVDDYTGFDPSHPELQVGNYLVVHATTDVEGATIYAKLSGEFKELDSDGILVVRVTDETKNLPLVFKATKDGYTTTVDNINISRLTLESAT